MTERFERNASFSIGYEVPPFSAHLPDEAALRASGARIVAGAGAASRDEPPHRAALALAARLGTTPRLFPGDHGGFGSEPVAFAAQLHDVLVDPPADGGRGTVRVSKRQA